MRQNVTRGHLRQRGNGTWQCQYAVNGVMRSITVHAKLKRDAWVLVEAEKQRRLETQSAGQRPLLVGDVLRMWLADHLPELAAPLSRQTYQQVVDWYIQPHLGHLPLAGDGCLSSTDVIAWKQQLIEKGLSAGTIENAIRRLKMALNWAMRQKPVPLVTFNAASDVKPPAAQPLTRGIFTMAEMRALLDTARPPFRCAIALGMLGLRRSEVLGIRRADYPRGDLKWTSPARIYVRQQEIWVRGEGRVQTKPKMARERFVAMPAWIVPILREQLEWSLSVKNARDTLLVSPDGNKALRGSTLVEQLHVICEQAGIPNPSIMTAVGRRKYLRDFHSLRHSWVVALRQGHVVDATIAQQGGWKNTALIVSLYGAHPDDDAVDRTASVMDELMANAAPATGEEHTGA